MSKCITLASILTFAACAHSTPPPAEATWAKPDPDCRPTRSGTCWKPTPVVLPPAAPPAAADAQPEAAAPLTPAAMPRPLRAAPDSPPAKPDADCRPTRSGTCWSPNFGAPIVKSAPEGAPTNIATPKSAPTSTAGPKSTPTNKAAPTRTPTNTASKQTPAASQSSAGTAAPTNPTAPKLSNSVGTSHETKTSAAERECQMITRAGTCWGQPKKPRVVKQAPGAKP